MNTITWSEFPKIEVRKEGYKRGLDIGVGFSPMYDRKTNVIRANAQNLIKIGALTGLFLLMNEIPVSAASLDEKAKSLYYGKLTNIAMWVIAGKGGFDAINKMLKEDYEGAKKSTISNLVIFVIFIGFPKTLFFVKDLFEV